MVTLVPNNSTSGAIVAEVRQLQIDKMVQYSLVSAKLSGYINKYLFLLFFKPACPGAWCGVLRAHFSHAGRLSGDCFVPWRWSSSVKSNEVKEPLPIYIGQGTINRGCETSSQGGLGVGWKPRADQAALCGRDRAS